MGGPGADGAKVSPGIALAQISAYIARKNLAVRKIMEAMRTAYAKKRDSSQHVSN